MPRGRCRECDGHARGDSAEQFLGVCGTSRDSPFPFPSSLPVILKVVCCGENLKM